MPSTLVQCQHRAQLSTGLRHIPALCFPPRLPPEQHSCAVGARRSVSQISMISLTRAGDLQADGSWGPHAVGLSSPRRCWLPAGKGSLAQTPAGTTDPMGLPHPHTVHFLGEHLIRHRGPKNPAKGGPGTQQDAEIWLRVAQEPSGVLKPS